MGSSLAVGFFVFVIFCTNKEGYPLETRTDDKYFFTLAVVDGLVMRCLAWPYRHLTILCLTNLEWCES